MIVVVAVFVFAGAAVAVTVLASVAARRPDLAAALLLVGVAAGGFAATGFGMLSLGVAGVEEALDGTPVGAGGPQPEVVYDPPRLLAGLGVAGALLGTAGVLVRRGDRT